jgi:hypothetical protein
MADLFLDPKKPLHTCKETNCEGCDVCSELSCHFDIKQLIHFLLVAFAAFLPGGIAIFRFHWAFLLVWIGMIIAYFLFTEIRVMCSHCPHYAEPSTKTLKCWANYGAPKIWKYRPGPMSKAEKIIFIIGMVTVLAYPLVFIILISAWDYLVIYVLAVAAFFTTLRMFLCSQCMNFACSFNRVDEETRDKFFAKNPVVAKAWGKKIDD